MAHVATDRLTPVVQRIERFIADGEIAGAALAVAVDGEPVIEWHAGDAAPGRPADPSVLWPVASISKLYTAAAIVALVEEGALTLSTPIREILPAFAGDEQEPILVRHLLTHTAGFVDDLSNLEQSLVAQAPLETLLEPAWQRPPAHTPGTAFSYSDLGYGVAGLIAAAVAKTSLADVIRSRVLDPARLHNTFLPPPAAEHRRVAYVTGSFAEGTPGALYNSPYARALEHGAMSAVATVGDLLRFGLLFAPDAEHTILSRASVRVMTTNQIGRPVAGNGADLTQEWGAGFQIRGLGDGPGDLLSPSSYGHWGATGCVLWIDPIDRLVIAYVSNTSVRANRVRFWFRINSVLNGVVGALT